MTYTEWEQTVPQTITGDPLWGMKVYRLALFLGAIAWQDVTKLLQDKRTIALADQLYRAVGSIGANIAEGYGRGSQRDQVRFYYQALLRRARESALPRRPAQTPSAYEQDLQAALPEAAASVDQLTQAFLEAQYSQHPIEPAAAETARTGWEALRQALRRRRARAAEGGETAMTTEAK